MPSSIVIDRLIIPLLVERLLATLEIKNMFAVLAMVLLAGNVSAVIAPHLCQVQHVHPKKDQPHPGVILR